MAADAPAFIDAVASAVIDVAQRIVVPRFRALEPHQILWKDTPGDPEDVVTVADREAEEALVSALSDLVPGAAFIGEEAVSSNPALLGALGSRAAWLIDPIDGTKNFARSDPRFGVMLALIEAGVTRASWMYMPALRDGELVTAEAGSGTRVNGRAVATAGRRPERPRGTVHTRLMPAPEADDILRRLEGRYIAHPSTGSAATEYTGILAGDKDFVIYYRLLPWDHAPGALALAESGGAAVHLTGAAYSAQSGNQVTIFAATPELARTVRGWLTV